MLGKREAISAETEFEVCAWQNNQDSNEDGFLELLNLQKSRSEQQVQNLDVCLPGHQISFDFDDQECCPARPRRIRKKSFEVFSEDSLLSVDSTTFSSATSVVEGSVSTQTCKSGNGSTVDDSDLRSVCPTESYAGLPDSTICDAASRMSRKADGFFKSQPKIDLKCLAKFVKVILDKEYPNPIYGNIIVNQVYDALTESDASARIPKSTYRKRISVILGVLQGCSVLQEISYKRGRTSEFMFETKSEPLSCVARAEQLASIEEKLAEINIKKTQLNMLQKKKSDLEWLITRNQLAASRRIQELSANSSSAVQRLIPDNGASSAASKPLVSLGICQSTGVIRVAPDAEISFEKSSEGLTVLSDRPLLHIDSFDLIRSG